MWCGTRMLFFIKSHFCCWGMSCSVCWIKQLGVKMPFQMWHLIAFLVWDNGFPAYLNTWDHNNYYNTGHCGSYRLGVYGFWAFAHIVGMGWELLKKCNNREEAVTDGFPWEFIKVREKNSTQTLSCHFTRGTMWLWDAEELAHPVLSACLL